MPATRSQTKQTHIEDFVPDKEPIKHESPKQSKTRPADSPQTTPSSKRQKTSASSAKKSMSKQTAALMHGKAKDSAPDDDDDSKDPAPDHDSEESIVINRAPVLDLWATTVTHFLYPSLSWDTCLSAGSAVSAICAVSKGRSIGVIDTPDQQDGEKAEKKREPEEIQVMGFKLQLKDNLVIVGGDKKPANEDAQKKKFGEEHYERAKRAFEDALKSWKDHEDELNKKAFGFYEKFRPTVAQGQRGWGRKGELNLEHVKEVIQREA